MKEIIIGLACLFIAGFILNRISSIILYFKIRKYKKFLKSSCSSGNKRITADYSRFREHFHVVIKMLKNKKQYNVVSLFSQYLLAIKETLEFEFFKDIGGIESNDDMQYIEQLLIQIGYSNTEWHLVCEAMDKDESSDEMMLKQLYWWPSFCLRFTGEKFLENSMKLLNNPNDNNIMNRIKCFANDLNIFKDVQNHLGVSEAIKINLLEMEKAFVNFLKKGLQNPNLTVGDLYEIREKIFTNSFVCNPYDLSGEKSAMSSEIMHRIMKLENDFKNSSTLVKP